MSRHACHPNAVTSTCSCSCCVYWSAVLTFMDAVSWGLVLGFIEQLNHSPCTVHTRATQWLEAKTYQIMWSTADCERYFYEYLNHAPASILPPCFVYWMLLFVWLLLCIFTLTTVFENSNSSSYHHYFCSICTTKETQPQHPIPPWNWKLGLFLWISQTPSNNSSLFSQ